MTSCFHISTGWEKTHWPLWERWYETDGKKGEEPPAEIKQLHTWWKKALTEPDNQKQIELGRKILAQHADQVYIIGTIGKSPRAVIADEDLRNVPEDAVWGWDTLTGCNMDLEAMYFVNGVNNE